ncbi:MAG: transcription-repair coupling factor, partial [Deltaproteobacteria bacterium]|nr:transcription-repair coupling factor [Deltaproteobacteria bacterium]
GGLELAPPPAPASPPAPPPRRLRFTVETNQELPRQLQSAEKGGETPLAPFARLVHGWLRDGWRVGLVVAGAGRAERAREMLKSHGFPVRIEAQSVAVQAPGRDGLAAGALRIVQGQLSAGLHVPAHALVLVTDGELFGERARRAPRRGRQALTEGMLAAFQELAEGDLVVHREHGVGRYEALVKLSVGGVENDYLLLTYQGGDKLYLPVQRLDKISRFVGAGAAAAGVAPALDKLGGVTWQRTRRRVKKGVEQLARELLELHAARKASRGLLFPMPDEYFREFEARFPFEETPDQETAIESVLAGMTRAGCMDHLVCGDVGYGKTEVALRAAFLAVLGGAQVAVLCPTTVLAAQHLTTFRERFAGFPVLVEGLSRFTPTREVGRILAALGEGKVDVLVGTHRILSQDVRFKSLGLVVIDEEQRFGVKQKERLKSLRTEVDVLTLTATPIPRTLSMALSGLKDISVIATPPVDRQAIRTFVTQWDPQVVREAVLQEISRGGQVFYVHNRVQHLPEVHRRLSALVPEARIGVAHGQMHGDEVEKVMLRFVQGEINVLLCTAIIESGLDIPRANTMVVEDAHTFGLAQLYQLRGRVGRSRQRAFAYLVVPPRRSMSEGAAQRLEALQRFSELGAGFQIASLDMELRGAGDLLGPDQSGNINAVGFELYAQLLEEAVQELQGEPARPSIEPELELSVSARIPEEYLPDTGLRLGLYKRLSRAGDLEEVGGIFEELVDRFGSPPPEVVALVQVMEIKALARRAGIRRVELRSGRLLLDLGEQPQLEPAQVLRLLDRPKSPWRLSREMLLSLALAPGEEEEEAALPAIREALRELLGHATQATEVAEMSR